MAMLLSLLYIIAWVGNLVCLILVLMKLFPAEGALKGVLGVICGLYTFIWGWMNKDKFNLGQIMMIWTGLVIAMFVLGGVRAAVH
jgi:hypothetical protein